jgi:hypothetical protein
VAVRFGVEGVSNKGSQLKGVVWIAVQNIIKSRSAKDVYHWPGVQDAVCRTEM